MDMNFLMLILQLESAETQAISVHDAHSFNTEPTVHYSGDPEQSLIP